MDDDVIDHDTVNKEFKNVKGSMDKNKFTTKPEENNKSQEISSTSENKYNSSLDKKSSYVPNIIKKQTQPFWKSQDAMYPDRDMILKIKNDKKINNEKTRAVNPLPDDAPPLHVENVIIQPNQV